MPHLYSVGFRHIGAVILLTCLLACSHEARREHVLDPSLTPPVALQAELNDSTGTVQLTWNSYEGQQPFASYMVLRRAARSAVVDTLQVLYHRDSTTVVDRSLAPSTSYEYRVAVTNAGGLEVNSQPAAVVGYGVGPVVLEPISIDTVAGEIHLRWSSYSNPGFEAYRVVRHQVGTDIDTTIFVAADVVDTVCADTSAMHSVPYRYTVQVNAAGQTMVSNTDDAILLHPAVVVRSPVFESDSASARLHWSAYQGSRFQHYEVQRRAPNTTYSSLATMPDVADTSFLDGDLRGATEYAYRVVVVTHSDERVASPEASGGIHGLVYTWNLEGLEKRPAMRLSRRSDDGTVEALLVLGDDVIRRARLSVGDPLSAEAMVPHTVNLAPQGYAMASTIDNAGRRTLVRIRTSAALVSRYRSDESLVWHETSLDLPLPGAVDAEVTLLRGFYRNFKLLSDDDVVLTDDFRYLPDATVVSGQFGPWQTDFVHLALGSFASVHGYMTMHNEAWTQLGLRTQAAAENDQMVRFRLGSADAGHLLFTMTTPPLACRCPDGGQVSLAWVTPETSDEEPALQVTVPTTLDAVGDLVEIEVQTGGATARAHLQTPERAGRQFEIDYTPVLCATANMDGNIIVTIDDSSFVLTDGNLLEGRKLPGRVGELRVWEGGRRGMVGMCLPDESLVVLGDLNAGPYWSNYATRTIGPGTGKPSSFLVSPISFDAGPDGRLFVLDAGNGRIVVFDAARQYVTEWGGWGSGPGQFKFGNGGSMRSETTGFFGSVAVDADGYVYVADEINRRIQVFAP